MNISNLQSQILKALFDIGNRQNNFSQLNKLVETVWANPEMLNDSFRIFCNKVADIKNHNVDLSFLIGFYEDMLQNITEFQNGFLSIYDTFFKAFPTESVLHSFIGESSNYTHLRAFFIILFWPPLFKNQIRKSHILKFLKLIRILSSDQKQCLSQWLTDMETERFYQSVNFLQDNLSRQVLKLLPDEFDKYDPIQISQCLMLICEGLSLFQRSNQILGRIQSKHFRNNNIMKYFSHNDQFNLHSKKIKLLNFIEYPFLLDLTYKNKSLEIQNKYQHQQTIERGLLNLINESNNQHLIINQAIIKSFYLQLQINRNNILQDSLNQITNTNLSLKNPLKISFVGEPGDDAGGVKKQYFQLLVKSIFNDNSDMFTTVNHNSFYWFNGLSYQSPIMFQLIGIILGLSIYNNTLLDVRFPRLIYKKLIYNDQKKLNCLEQLEQIDPDLQKSLKYILNTKEQLQPMQLYFDASVTHFEETINFQIKPNGSLIKVTQSNKYEYVTMMFNWVINEHIQKQFNAFKKGFYRVVTGDMIKLFSAEELEKIICGSNIIDINELRKGARYSGGFKPDTSIILNFWQVLNEFNHEQRKAFLFFATGSDRTPVGGLSSLKFIIERHTTDSQMLPSSRTCSNLLLIPEYSHKDKLKQKLLLAIQYKQGFGLI